MARGDNIKQDRRRRNSEGLSGQRNRLAINQAILDKENFVYRFVNDVPGRIHELTVNDDWEVVQNRDGTIKTDGTGTGSEVSVHVGQTAHGHARAVLLRKPKQWHEDDKRSMQRHIDEVEKGLKAGQAPGADADPGKEYVPHNGIIFENGAKS